MQHYPIYQPLAPKMVEQFLQKSPWCVLITQNQEAKITSGIFNPLVEGQEIYLHLHFQDVQLKQIEEKGKASLLFIAYHGFVPSYAKDPDDASFASMFYRFAEVEATAEIISNDEVTAMVMDRMMAHYQPEGGYLSLSAHSEKYKASLPMIRLVKFNIESTQCKWKLGQNRSPQEQLIAHSFIS